MAQKRPAQRWFYVDLKIWRGIKKELPSAWNNIAVFGGGKINEGIANRP